MTPWRVRVRTKPAPGSASPIQPRSFSSASPSSRVANARTASCARSLSSRSDGFKSAGDRRLLDHVEAADLAQQRLQQVAHLARLLDEIAEVVASALHAVMLVEDGIAQPRGDAMLLERRLVLEIDRLARAALHLEERRLGDVEDSPSRSAPASGGRRR